MGLNIGEHAFIHSFIQFCHFRDGTCLQITNRHPADTTANAINIVAVPGIVSPFFGSFGSPNADVSGGNKKTTRIL